MQQETSKRCSGKILRRRAAVRQRVFSGLSKIKGRVRGESAGKESQADVKFVGGYSSNKFGKIKEYKKQLWKLLGRLDEDDGWLWKGSEAPRYTALIPSVRTLADSKLGVDLYRGSSSWNTIGVPSSKVFGYKN
ncbi:hypothetical protein B296_00006659 [Ensete ventricosum]|uniref:Uncharacterized protein n=1 Tax=Ensete ventricosum TaxID=4639 RepID=A0A427B6Y5_ENSVE|nr:hypothetical protein B296_00006659 [Ensete ventricosum]